MRLGESLFVLLPSESHDEEPFPSSNSHVAVDHESDTVEHLLLGETFSPSENVTNPLDQRFVDCHEGSILFCFSSLHSP
jgi:hypothetical protein